MPRVLERAAAAAHVLDSSARRRGRYLGWLAGATIALLAATAIAVAVAGRGRWAPLVALIALPVAVQLADSVVRLVLVTLARPTAEPPRVAGTKLATAMAATVVVYPAIVHNRSDVDDLLTSVRENREAVGRGPALHLALVDFADSPQETDDADDALRDAIQESVAALPDGPAPVAVLFRRRVWNPREGIFMGWERKRGKLEELISLIGGRKDTSFIHRHAADQKLVDRLQTMRYVLTIDVGDRLAPRAARRLIGAIAHPDNAAVLAPGGRLVVAGFGFARPIFEPSPPNSLFEWATYPYRQPDGVPSPAQAAFGSDDFLGKGVIDVLVYQTVLTGRIPPNRVLSHDRLEGMHARTVAVTDARIVEANVGDYLQFRARQHRWVRGDTHLLPWIVGRADVTRLSLVDRLGLARDLIGHLYPASLTAALVLVWLAAPAGQVGWWTALLLAVSAHPIVITTVLPQLVATRAALTGPGGRDVRRLATIWRRTTPAVLRLGRAELARWLMFLATMADTALVTIDALLRAVYRMAVSHRHVLQWTTSSQRGQAGNGLRPHLRQLWPTSLFAGMLAVMVTVMDPFRLMVAGPLLLIWLGAPLVTYWLSRPVDRLPDMSMT